MVEYFPGLFLWKFLYLGEDSIGKIQIMQEWYRQSQEKNNQEKLFQSLNHAMFKS